MLKSLPNVTLLVWAFSVRSCSALSARSELECVVNGGSLLDDRSVLSSASVRDVRDTTYADIGDEDGAPSRSDPLLSFKRCSNNNRSGGRKVNSRLFGRSTGR